MADAVTPAAACAGGVVSMACLASLGFDPAHMVWGLMGVVIVQTCLPRTENKPLTVAGIAVGSTLLANVGAPFVAPAVMSTGENWAWLKSVDPAHIKAASAAVVGGFAQPLLLWGKSLLPKPRDSSLPQPKE